MESQTNQSHSSELKDLFLALSKAQGEMGICVANKNVDFALKSKDGKERRIKYKYSSPDHVIMHATPHLKKNELSVAQPIIYENNAYILYTILGHSSGQWIKSKIKLGSEFESNQAMGSAITYIKRYAYVSILGIALSDEDDDAEETRKIEERKEFKKQEKIEEPKRVEKITPEQLDLLEHEIRFYPDIKKEVEEGLKKKYNVQSLADMPKSIFNASIDKIKEMKDLRK